MIKFCVAGISALLEPGTAASATTEFAEFLDRATLGASVAAHRGCTCPCRGFCGDAGVMINQDKQTHLQSSCTSPEQPGDHTSKND